MTAPLRICLIASSRHPVSEPFAGGLEAHTHQLATALLARGHDVTLFAGPGSDAALHARVLPVPQFETTDAARNDVAAWPAEWMSEHHAYLGLMLDLVAHGDEKYDVVHNNSLHHLPIAMARAVSVPMVTTLHTPPVPWLESAIRFAPDTSTFAAVSRATSRAWASTVHASVVHNGVDTDRWIAGPGRGAAIWTGRLVPEKGAHLAILAARAAGIPMDLAGPLSDPAYYAREVAPLLGDDVRYLGHLPHRELIEIVGRASVAVITPRWEEPYGLVAAEALACGTPVAAFARGALSEIVPVHAGRLAIPDDVADLARAMREAATLDRQAVREHAVRHCSVATMTDGYEAIYRDLVEQRLCA